MADKAMEEALEDVRQKLEGAVAATVSFNDKLKAFRDVGDQMALEAIRRELAIRKLRTDCALAQEEASSKGSLALQWIGKIKHLESELANCKTDLEGAREANGKLYLRKTELEMLIHNKEGELVRRQGELECKGEELAAYRGEARDLRQLCAKKQGIIDNVTADAEKIGDRLAVMSSDLAERDRIIDELHKEVDEASREARSAGCRAAGIWSHDLAERDRIIKDLRADYSSLERANVNLRADCARLMKAHDAAEERGLRGDALQDELDERDHMIKKISDVLAAERRVAWQIQAKADADFRTYKQDTDALKMVIADLRDQLGREMQKHESDLAKNIELSNKLSLVKENYQLLAETFLSQAAEIFRLKETK